FAKSASRVRELLVTVKHVAALAAFWLLVILTATLFVAASKVPCVKTMQAVAPQLIVTASVGRSVPAAPLIVSAPPMVLLFDAIVLTAVPVYVNALVAVN